MQYRKKILAASVAACSLGASADVIVTDINGPDVGVDLTCEVEANTANCDKIFNEIAEHNLSLQLDYQGPIGTTDAEGFSGILFEDILNETGIPWTDYHFGFSSEVPGFGWELLELEAGPANPEFGEDMLWIFFDQPILPGGSFDLTLEFFASVDGPVEFIDAPVINIEQYPSIPEPGTTALLGAGAAGLAALRRRKQRRKG